MCRLNTVVNVLTLEHDESIAHVFMNLLHPLISLHTPLRPVCGCHPIAPQPTNVNICELNTVVNALTLERSESIALTDLSVFCSRKSGPEPANTTYCTFRIVLPPLVDN